MRNRFPGECYRCNGWVPAGEGHFERLGSTWRVQHAACAIEFRGTPDPARRARQIAITTMKAQGTGKRANRARKTLREQSEAAQ